MKFVGRSLALSQAGLDAAASLLDLHPIELWTVLRVETRGCGFLSDRRPQILFERHCFHRLTATRFDATNPEVSAPSAGGYGADGAHQYDRLEEALALDRTAALRSASWGLGQVMGDNFTAAGHPDAEAFVTAMIDGEDAQLLAMCNFIRANGLADALRAHDWTTFARSYNGAAFARNHYDVRLAQEHAKLSAGKLPDLDIRAAQLYLLYRGLDPHGVDGIDGKFTRSALAEFQAQVGLQATGELTDETKAALLPT